MERDCYPGPLRETNLPGCLRLVKIPRGSGLRPVWHGIAISRSLAQISVGQRRPSLVQRKRLATHECKSTKEIIRCLKRYVAREVFPIIVAALSRNQTRLPLDKP